MADQRFAQPAQQIVLEESIEAVRLGEQRRTALTAFCARKSRVVDVPLVENLGALRGLDTIASAGLAAAIGTCRASPQPPTSWPTSAWRRRNIPPAPSAAWRHNQER